MDDSFNVWVPGTKYHITSRGVRKMALFHDDKDYYQYLSFLQETKQKYPFILHTYCLMTNHIHLQLETIDNPPGIIMKHLHTKYAKYFNRRHDFKGHLFESRYGRQVINRPDYELDVSKYIHVNPLKANMVQNLDDYHWSSYRSYILNERNPLITTKQVLSYFNEPKSLNYERFLKATYLDQTIYLINPLLSTLNDDF
jgi:putative transposase